MKQIIQDESKCCGCSACEQICPKNAIQMVENEKGFLYPQIDETKCVHCGACSRVCAFSGEHTRESTIRAAYALQHRNEDVLKKSSSGGAFIALSDLVLKEGGAIFGAVMDDYTCDVHHAMAENKTERDRMCGSKYVQSNTQGVFVAVKEQLQAGRTVLFSGMPCQVAELIRFLNGHPDNLITVDLLCHGAPSNRLLKDHVQMWQENSKKKIKSFHYRSKAYAYAYAYACELVLENDSVITPVNLKRLVKLYELSMRESCYACPYAQRHRFGDITIGDMFDCGSKVGIYDAKGMSSVFVNTDHGEALMDKLKESCRLISIQPEKLSISALEKPVKKSGRVDAFWSEYFEKGYRRALDKYAPKKLKSSGYILLWRILYRLKLHRLALKLGMR